jgi:DNA-binding transcriptional regulator LsrR (DeoR family)
MAKRQKHIPEELRFRILEKFMMEKHKGRRLGAEAVAAWVRSKGYPCSREHVYELINQGIRNGHLRLCPPAHVQLSRELARTFRFPENQMEVVNVIGPSIEEHLAQVAAERLMRQIDEVGRMNKEVHIGFGAGQTTMLVARALANVVRQETKLPQLVIHALSSGFSVDRPETAPLAYFAYFSGLNPPVQFVGLFASAVVQSGRYNSTKKLDGVHESFERAREIDIVVTSLAQWDDPHGQLNSFQAKNTKGQTKLENANCVGDIQWRPYSDTGPINVNTGIRAVTLFELPDLKDLAETPGKYVTVVCGRCSVCERDKARALLPLLHEPSLRVLNHLVTNTATAQRVLELENQLRPSGKVTAAG